MKIIRGLIWVALVLSIAALVASLPGYAARVGAAELNGEFSAIQLASAALGVLLSIGCAALSLALGTLLLVKKPHEGMALLLAGYLFMYGIFMSGPEEAFFGFWLPSSGSLGAAIQALIFPVPSLVLFLTFPNGRFVPRWTVWCVPAALVLTVYAVIVAPDPDQLNRMNTLPIQLVYGGIGFLLLLALGSQVYRYRGVSNPIERQQTKWVLYGFALSYGVLALVSIPYYYMLNLPEATPAPWWVSTGGLAWWLALTIQPIAFTVAILRARLWDIDLIIHRTVTYALLTLTLALVYLGSVILLQRVLSSLTGAAQNELVTVLSTLAIAALFVPLRNRIQSGIEERFNRRKYDAQKVLERFAVSARDETDLSHLAGKLTQVVEETMQPASVSVWLRPGESMFRKEPR